MSEQANRKYAESLLNGGRDPGGAYPDLQQRYQKHQQELARAHTTHNPQPQKYADNPALRNSGRSSGNSTTPPQVGRSASSGWSSKSLFGIGGFICGALIGARLFDGNGIAILILAGICAWIASVAYKLIIGSAVVILVLAAIFNSENKTSGKTAFEVSSQAAQRR